MYICIYTQVSTPCLLLICIMPMVAASSNSYITDKQFEHKYLGSLHTLSKRSSVFANFLPFIIEADSINKVIILLDPYEEKKESLYILGV